MTAAGRRSCGSRSNTPTTTPTRSTGFLYFALCDSGSVLCSCMVAAWRGVSRVPVGGVGGLLCLLGVHVCLWWPTGHRGGAAKQKKQEARKPELTSLLTFLHVARYVHKAQINRNAHKALSSMPVLAPPLSGGGSPGIFNLGYIHSRFSTRGAWGWAGKRYRRLAPRDGSTTTSEPEHRRCGSISLNWP